MTKLDVVLNQKGRPLLGAAVYFYDPVFVEMCCFLGVDVLWLEMEHAAIPLEGIADLCRIAAAAHVLTMIRLTDSRRENVLRAAECGPDILDLPMGDTEESLREMVHHSRFPPTGGRGFFGASRAVRYGISGNLVAEQQRINRELSLWSQIETRQAVESAESLCAVAGIDGIFLGPGDLSASLGVPGQVTHPTVLAAMDRAINVAKTAGKRVALFTDPAQAGRWYDRADVLFCTSDVACMRNGLQSAMDKFHMATQRAEA
jgi:4-hydroxy-2-oxoheptanedioate aldolase